jgi:hypothetical protein
MEEFKMKFKEIADEIFSEAINNINKEYRPSLFILVKKMENEEVDVNVLPVHDPAMRKEAGDFVSIISYKVKTDLVLFISETTHTLAMVYTESDGKNAIKIGMKDITPGGETYIEDTQWAFNVPFEQYVSPWNEDNRLVIKKIIDDNPPLPIEDSKIVEMVGDLLKNIVPKSCPCEKCKKERGEILESGSSVHGNFDNVLNKLEIPTDRGKIN